MLFVSQSVQVSGEHVLTHRSSAVTLGVRHGVETDLRGNTPRRRLVLGRVWKVRSLNKGPFMRANPMAC